MGFRPIDADNHHYEPLDAFTRHIDPRFAARAVQPVTDQRGHVQLLVGGRICRFVPNPTFDPIVVPGCLDAFFRGRSRRASIRDPDDGGAPPARASGPRMSLLVKRLRKQRDQTPWGFVEDPLDTLRRHVWVTPYCRKTSRRWPN